MKRILIIEDDPIVAVVYQRFLSAHEFQIEVAKDGAAGLQLLETFAPDAVLLDLMMPKVSGLEVLKAIRANARWANLPVLVMTAAAVPMLIKMAQDAGANRVFDKSNDKPLGVVNYLHDLLRTTSDARLISQTKSGNPDSVLDHWPTS